ncbi:MAG: hypothetical protein J6S85_21375 [Methanobrevibacter sp.]|nr:hypothetical protein [Methanobrevibacter sp.]
MIKEGQKIQEAVNKYGLTYYSYMKICPKNVQLFYKRPNDKYGVEYTFTLDGNKTCLKTGSEFYSYLRKCGKEQVPTFDEMSERLQFITMDRIGKSSGNKFMNVQAGILWSNKNYNRKRTPFHSYDINSAYASCIYNKIPDTRDYSGVYRELEKDEIGFIFGGSLTLVTEGYADICFKLVDTNDRLKKFLSRWYLRKQNKEDGAKECLTYAFGYLQYKNPYLRAYIVELCNQKMIHLMDNNTILINTDCIWTTKPIDILELGTNIGQYKPAEGFITINGLNYKEELLDKIKDKHRGVTHPIYKVVNNRIEEIQNE